MSINTQTLLTIFIDIAIALVIALLAKKVASILINKYFTQIYKTAQSKGRSISKKRINTLSGAVKSIVNVVIWLVFVVVVLGLFNVKMTALLTGAGATAIIFGIAGRDIIMDLYVGFMALIEDQYRVGDDIEVNKDHAGIVEEISLRTVRLRDREGNVHIVPHSLARSIINKTYDYSLVTVELVCEYTDNVELIKETLNSTGKLLAQDERWKRVFIDPMQFETVLAFDKKEMAVKAIGKVKPGKQIAAESEYKLRAADALEKAGIVVPSIETAKKDTEPATKKKAKK